MKKTLVSFFAIALSIAALVSCSKEIPSPIDEDQLIEVTLIAGNPEAQPATKTEMSGTKPYWSVGDKIGVSTGTSGNYEFSTGIAAASTTASFTGSTVSGDLYAYYPYDDDNIRTAIGVTGKRLNLIKDQYPTATSFDGDADIMVAKKFTVSPENTTVEDLEFARLGAIVKIVLIDEESKMTGTQYPTSVSMTAASDLAGYVMLDLVNQEMTDPYYNTSTTVTANYTNETHFAINGTNGAYLIVAPQTLAAGSSLTIAAATADYTISKTITVPAGGIELLPGKVNTLNIGLSSSHINANGYPYQLYSGDITEGDYLIVYDGVAMKATVNSDRLQYTSVSISDNKVYNPSVDIIWHIAQSGEYWTIYNADSDKYAASTGAKSKAQLLDDGSDDKSKWTVSGSSTYEFVNKANAAASANANLRRNGTYGFACYGTGTGGALSLYKLNDGKTAAGIAYARTSDVITFGDALTPPTLSNAHGLTISCSSDNTDVATVNATTGEISVVGNAGVAVITVSWAEQTISTVTYRAGSVKYTLTINKKTPTIADFVDPPTSLAVAASVTKTTTISDGLAITYTSSNDAVATVNATTGEVTGVADGNVTISATFAGNANFNAAETKSYALTVGAGGGPTPQVVTMQYSGSTTNMTGGNDAATVGLDADKWSVVGAKGGNANYPGLNKAGDIRLYWTNGDSNTITVTSLESGATINSIVITYTGDSYNNGKVLVGGDEVSLSGGSYTINNTSFVITNGNTSNVQVRISSVAITYTPAS